MEFVASYARRQTRSSSERLAIGKERNGVDLCTEGGLVVQRPTFHSTLFTSDSCPENVDTHLAPYSKNRLLSRAQSDRVEPRPYLASLLVHRRASWQRRVYLAMVEYLCGGITTCARTRRERRSNVETAKCTPNKKRWRYVLPDTKILRLSKIETLMTCVDAKKGQFKAILS